MQKPDQNREAGLFKSQIYHKSLLFFTVFIDTCLRLQCFCVLMCVISKVHLLWKLTLVLRCELHTRCVSVQYMYSSFMNKTKQRLSHREKDRNRQTTCVCLACRVAALEVLRVHLVPINHPHAAGTNCCAEIWGHGLHDWCLVVTLFACFCLSKVLLVFCSSKTSASVCVRVCFTAYLCWSHHLHG